MGQSVASWQRKCALGDAEKAHKHNIGYATATEDLRSNRWQGYRDQRRDTPPAKVAPTAINDGAWRTPSLLLPWTMTALAPEADCVYPLSVARVKVLPASS
ncbi:hypothetical protein AAFF_G00305030 [Aldrovandia affinis]|uniref:Uncharacterized protein n=1 Tax=Aldrovandia affinis TaxID=143900 RepID=A0AAD7WR74_9TELE|nr:hypothetical protein AAFF_G00305030 [Aldrovandia affinis]